MSFWWVVFVVLAVLAIVVMMGLNIQEHRKQRGAVDSRLWPHLDFPISVALYYALRELAICENEGLLATEAQDIVDGVMNLYGSQVPTLENIQEVIQLIRERAVGS